MNARDELADIKSRAEKFIAAHDEMIRIGKGVGGLATERTDLMPDFDAWWHASDYEHADTVIAVIEATKPRVVTTVEELDALPVGSVLNTEAGAWEKVSDPDDADDITFWLQAGNRRWNPSRDVTLPATVLYEPGADQ